MRASAALVGLLVLASPLRAQQDGPAHPFQDSLLERLAGTWSMTGDLRGTAQRYVLTVEWVLNHQFLRIEMKDAGNPRPYEAVSYIGYDNASERYVAHWIDVFGGRWSETLGFGVQDGRSVRFTFEYPDGPFRSVYTFDGEGGWRIDMTRKTAEGTWQDFARYRLRRSPADRGSSR